MSRPLAWLLLLALVLCYLVPLGVRPLSVPDEARYAQIAREMIDSGDWVVPRLLGLRYFEKPVGGYWLNALAMMLVSDVRFGVRLPTALAALGTAALVALLVRRGTGRAGSSLLAATIQLSSFMVFGIGTHAVLDTMLSFWLTAALVAFWCAFTSGSGVGRLGWWTGFGAACGCAFLTKGFIALAVPVAAVAPFLLWQRRWRELLGFGAWSVLVAALIALPWSLLIHTREPRFWEDFFWNEHVKRFAAEDAQHRQPFWFYLPVLALLALPWTLALPGALRRAWQDGVRGGVPGQGAFERFLLLALAMPVLLFSAAKGKLATYVLPCSAPLAALLALHIGALLQRREPLRALMGWVWLHLGLAVVGLLGLATLPFLFGGHRWVQGQAVPLGGLAAGVALWLLLDLAVVRQRLHVVAGCALQLLCLVVVLPLCWSHPALIASMPERALRACAPRLPPDALLACATVRLAPGMAIEFGRADLVIVGDQGELKAGLDYLDTPGRYVGEQRFPEWLAQERTRQPVVLMALDGNDPFRQYPQPDRYERTGSLSVFFYDRRPG